MVVACGGNRSEGDDGGDCDISGESDESVAVVGASRAYLRTCGRAPSDIRETRSRIARNRTIEKY